MPRWAVKKKKFKQVSTAPMGKRNRKKKIKAGIRGPVGHGKKTKYRYPRSRWTEKYGVFW